MTDRTQESLETLSLKTIKPEDQIAPNFKVYELTKSKLASRLGVTNNFATNAEIVRFPT